MTRIVVIGAGVMGASAAYRLAQGGAKVTILEAGRVGGGTSGVSFAWTNSHSKRPLAYHKLNVGGMQAHAAIRDEFPGAPWWHGGGSLEWADAAERADMVANVERLQSWGYAAEWIDLKQLQELEPDIDPAVVGDAPVVYYRADGWLDPVVYAHALISAARRRYGAELVCGARVADLTMQGDRVTGVKTADGAVYPADMVVNCAGRWSNDVVQDAGLQVPLAPTVGFLVYTPPVAASLSHLVRCPVIHVRPDGAGRLMMHWNPTDRTLSFDTKLSPQMPEARDLMQRVRKLLPSIGAVEAEAVRIALRPIPGDQLSAVGPVPRVTGYYLAVTHSAVTMSPYFGLAVADEIVRNQIRPELADFRPNRFFN